jgi:predicted secreted Zn-dependent protease
VIPFLLTGLLAACGGELRTYCKGLEGDGLRLCLAQYAETPVMGASCRAALDAKAPLIDPKEDNEVEVSVKSADGEIKGFGVDLEEKTAYYDISGKTPNELAAAMGRSGITDGIDGTNGAAATGASMNVKYSRADRAGGCGLDSARVQLSVLQKLPRWEPPAGAKPAVTEWWNKAWSAIVAHENGHKQIDLDMAQAALGYLKRIETLPDCSKLDDLVYAEIRRAHLDATNFNVAYDRQTQHGQTQYDEAFGRKR